MLDFSAQAESKRVIVALDCDGAEALRLARVLVGGPEWLKVGMTLFYQEGPAIVAQLKQLGFKVFLDLKLHDIPHQVEGAAFAATMAGADMLTVHAAGGLEMMKAAKKGVEQAVNIMRSGKQVSALQKSDVYSPVTLGVTVLTSMNEQALHSVGVVGGVNEQITRLALLAQQAGLSGVVASPLEARMLRDVLGAQACICTPGIRPLGADLADQSRVMTPERAFSEGASCIVIGRPITQAADPQEAFCNIKKGLNS